MTIQDETRFRHLAACIATAAQHLQVDEKPDPLTIIRIRVWINEMADICPEPIQKGASRKKEKSKCLDT